MIHVRRNLLCTYNSLRGKPTDKYLDLFCYLPREVCTVLLQVGGNRCAAGGGAQTEERDYCEWGWGWGWGWRGGGLALQVVLGITFHCNLSHAGHRRDCGFAAQKASVQLRPLYGKCAT